MARSVAAEGVSVRETEQERPVSKLGKIGSGLWAGGVIWAVGCSLLCLSACSSVSRQSVSAEPPTLHETVLQEEPAHTEDAFAEDDPVRAALADAALSVSSSADNVDEAIPVREAKPTAKSEAEKTAKGKAAKNPTARATTARSKSGSSGSPEWKAYQAALAVVQARRCPEGEHRFDEFMRNYPGSSLMPNALYWKGECLYSRGQYSEAILVFKDVVSRFPKHAKAADSLLKAGMSYGRMHDAENARFHYQVLSEDYPAAEATRRGRQLGLFK